MNVNNSLPEAAGAGARMIRLGADKSLDDVATAARRYGLRWSTGSVGDFEAGRTSPNLATLLIVATVLRDLTGAPVTLADLFRDDVRERGGRQVAIRPDLVMPRSAVRAALSGEPVALPAAQRSYRVQLGDVTMPELIPRWASGVDPRLHQRVFDAFTETDARTCKAPGLSAITGAAAMARLWGRTFVAERNARAEAGANAQRLGRISRQLRAELAKEVDRDGDR
jgi:hypothetical protein